MLEASETRFKDIPLDAMAHLSTLIESDRDFVSYITIFKKLYEHGTVKVERLRRMEERIIEKRNKFHQELLALHIHPYDDFDRRSRELFLCIAERFAATQHVGSDELYACVNKLDEELQSWQNVLEYRPIPAENIAAEGEENVPADKFDFTVASILNEIANILKTSEHYRLDFLRDNLKIFQINVRKVEEVNNFSGALIHSSLNDSYRSFNRCFLLRGLSLLGSGIGEVILGFVALEEGMSIPLIVLLSINTTVFAVSATAQCEASTGFLSQGLRFFRQRIASGNNSVTPEVTPLLPEVSEVNGEEHSDSYQGVFVQREKTVVTEEDLFGPHSNLPPPAYKQLGA